MIQKLQMLIIIEKKMVKGLFIECSVLHIFSVSTIILHNMKDSY